MISDIFSYICFSGLCLTFYIVIAKKIYNYTKFSGEDTYQNLRYDEGVKQHIYASGILSDNADKNIFFSEIQNKIQEQIKDYFELNPKISKYLLDRVIYREETKEESELGTEQLWNYISEQPINEIFVIYNKDKGRYSVIMDHRYLGGLFFLTCSGRLIDAKPVRIYKESYFPFFSEYYIMKFIYFWYNKSINKDRLTVKKDIDRILINLDYKDGANYHMVRSQTYVYFHVLHMIYNSLKIKKKFLRVILPVAFDFSGSVFNSVGVIFIDFDENTTPYKLEKMIIDRKYQAIATNTLQKFINKGRKARKDVDVVFTSGLLVSNSKDNDMKINKEIMISYLSVADYPIYILGLSVDNRSYITITNMSNELDLEKMKNLDNNNHEIVKISPF